MGNLFEGTASGYIISLKKQIIKKNKLKIHSVQKTYQCNKQHLEKKAIVGKTVLDTGISETKSLFLKNISSKIWIQNYLNFFFKNG